MHVPHRHEGPLSNPATTTPLLKPLAWDKIQAVLIDYIDFQVQRCLSRDAGYQEVCRIEKVITFLKQRDVTALRDVPGTVSNQVAVLIWGLS